MNNLFPLRTTTETVHGCGIPNGRCGSAIQQSPPARTALGHHAFCAQLAPQHVFSSQGEFPPSINFDACFINIHQQESPGKLKVDIVHHVLWMAFIAHVNFREIPKELAPYWV